MVVALNNVHMAVVSAGKMVQTIHIQKRNPGFHHFTGDDLLTVASVALYAMKSILKFKSIQNNCKSSFRKYQSDRFLLIILCVSSHLLFICTFSIYTLKDFSGFSPFLYLLLFFVSVHAVEPSTGQISHLSPCESYFLLRCL